MSNKIHPNLYFDEFIKISINEILTELENKNIITKSESDNVIDRIVNKKPTLEEVDWNA